MSRDDEFFNTWDAWVRVDGVLAFVLSSEVLADERERIARARAAGNALPEARIADVCMRAGIEVRWSDPDMAVVDSMAWVPAWVAPYYEATISQSAQQMRVLKRAQADLQYREAGLSVWRLGGLEALVKWLEVKQ